MGKIASGYFLGELFAVRPEERAEREKTRLAVPSIVGSLVE